MQRSSSNSSPKNPSVSQSLHVAPLGRDRSLIDQADRALVVAIGQRLAAVRSIAQAKAKSEMGVVDRAREDEVTSRWRRLAEEEGINPHAAGRVLAEILDWSRREQECVNPSAKTVRVAYQGAPGANGDLAALRLMAMRRAAAETAGYETFDGAVGALAEGHVDYALIPVENSILGNIEASSSALLDGRFSIVDEERWSVRHCLAARPGTRIESVRRVLSHPVALRQCRRTLVESMGVETVEVWDTAGAARLVASGESTEDAAVCPVEAAERYGLDVLRDDVSDHPDNWTRFLLLARDAEDAPAGVPCRTTLRFVADHTSGSLARCLGAFEAHGVNLTRLASHVLPQRPGQYGFLVDLEGHVKDESVAAALELVRGAARQLSVLGSYPNRMNGVAASKASTSTPEAPSPPTLLPAAAKKPAPKGLSSKGLSLVSKAPAARLCSRELAGVPMTPDSFVLIAGPCAVESKDQIEEAAKIVGAAGASLMRGGAFKPRTSTYSFQGLGLPGVQLLSDAGRRHGLPVVTEVLRARDVQAVAATADVLQIGARNMQNFDLLRAVGTANRPVLLKRGMSATVDEWLHAAEYILAAGNQQVVLCERGIRTFETSTRATLDIASIAVVKERTHLPVIVDPSHAAGRRELVIPLALAAAAAGADGLIVECHPDPEAALCDKQQALTADDLRTLVAQLTPILAGQGRTLA